MMMTKMLNLAMLSMRLLTRHVNGTMDVPCQLPSRKASEELPIRLGIANITNILRKARLRCFGNVERMDNGNLVNVFLRC